MKTNLTKRRFQAPKAFSCATCKPNKRGGQDKKTIRDLRFAVKHDQEIHETHNAARQ